MTPSDVPVLPRGVRRHHDRVRNVPVLLGPERVLMLDQIGCAVLDEVDGQASIDAICTRLSEKYAAPADQISEDVIAYLSDLANKRLLDLNDG